MFKAIADDISKAINTPYNITSKVKVTGGDINQAYRVSNGEQHFFVKINEKHCLENFQTEAFSLDHLVNNRQLRVPKVICYGETLDHSYLVLEYLEMHTSASNNADSDFFELGKAIAHLHNDNQQAEFGWPEDNYIGTTPQLNNYKQNWSVFFSENRIGYQLRLLADQGIALGNIDELVHICQQFLASHHPIPCLVHGDLWQGNVAFVDSSPCIYDPACYYADREVDIAMTELFGRLPESFYQGYNSIYPLGKNYNLRKNLYNGYHILNHANLFAGIYVDQAKTFIKELKKIG